MGLLKGQCLCGQVQFETGKPEYIDACHCKTCQRWTGGVFIGADYRHGDVTLTNDTGLTWYQSSDWAKRGFCKNCGTSLFYRLNDDPDFWAIGAGTLDGIEDNALGKEIFIDEKPDYYSLAGDHPRLTGEAFFKSLQDINHD